MSYKLFEIVNKLILARWGTFSETHFQTEKSRLMSPMKMSAIFFLFASNSFYWQLDTRMDPTGIYRKIINNKQNLIIKIIEYVLVANRTQMYLLSKRFKRVLEFNVNVNLNTQRLR